MHPIALGFFTATGAILANEGYKRYKAKHAPPPPPGTALDPGMDEATASVVRKALESETDSKVLDHLGVVLLAAGFPKSASAVADRSSHVKAVVKTTQTATSGMWSDIADLLHISVDPIDARELQRSLNALGYGPLAVDGVVGPHTVAALHAFQASKNIPFTDHANVDTVAAIHYQLGTSAEL